MKKTFLKASYKLKILNDGSTYYKWEHPWKGWIPLTVKDITNSHLKLNKAILNSNLEQANYINLYTKKFDQKKSS